MGTTVGTRFVLIVEEEINRIRWAPGVTIFGRDARATISAVDSVSSGGRRPLLVHINSVERITPAARQILLADTCSTRTAVLGTDPNARSDFDPHDDWGLRLLDHREIAEPSGLGHGRASRPKTMA